MKVRYLVSEAAVAWSRMPGVVYDLPDEEAVAALNAGKAEPVKEETEAAVKSPPKGK